MKNIKKFIKKNKVLIVEVGIGVAVGFVVYKLTKSSIVARNAHIAEGEKILKVFKDSLAITDL